MPRNYIKKTSSPRYTKDYKKKAVLEVKNGSAIIYAVSKKRSVPEETVRRWIVKSPSHQGQESFKEVKQGSWIEVEYRSRSQSSKFIGQVIDINEFHHIEYPTNSPLGDYYTFPAIER
ncbi:uncharacterized protein TNIN_335011 [Trichonephila inaurata madagascariensis]|uniref:Transposase n=1 Tax=Trichonephila inaurata madagascariensis TaxID=2747483 RepID=A0A8X6XJX7_9ARAC|nr:uncharacterized protein TNIN_335011 [Trichonephila inaurata madagascariensis]